MGKLQVNGDIKASGTISSGNDSLVMSTSGSLTTYLTTTSGWARGWAYNVNDTYMGGFGFYGSGSTKVNSFYVGAYNASWMNVTPEGVVTATKFVGSLQGNADTASSASWASGASYAQRVAGSYTGNGGAQGPSYIGRGNVKFNMMNQFPNAGTTNYMDCILMNTYGGGDVPRATAFGIERYTGRAWIAEGSDTSSTWERVYEVISTRNIASQSVNYASSAGNADTVDGWHADGFLQKHGWWSSGGSYSVDNLTSGIVFAYSNHGAPSTWGHTIAFTSGGNNAYVCQLHATGTNRLFMRNKSSDYGQKDWVEFYTTSGGDVYGNIIVNTYNNALTIGSLNEGWCHFQSSANRPFYFNRTTFVDGAFGIYGMNSQGVGSSFPSSPERGQIFFKI